MVNTGKREGRILYDAKVLSKKTDTNPIIIMAKGVSGLNFLLNGKVSDLVV